MPSTTIPYWVEPPPALPGSIDPLGYLAESDQTAEQLLPGMTVSTTRARYLSFLCWAIRETGNDSLEIDRWEIALSISEFLRHSSNKNVCTYLGVQLLQQRKPQLQPGDRIPSRLHVQTARILYSGLLVSCGLFDEKGDQLTKLGQRVANEFSKDMGPKTRPKQVFRCEGMPCLSQIRDREMDYLRQGLLENNDDAAKRLQTFKEVGVPQWREIRKNRVDWLLKKYLGRPNPLSKAPARLLHEAARLELQSMPLTGLFLYLYENNGLIRGSLPRATQFHPYRARKDPREMLADVAAHLRMASKLGSPLPKTLPGLKIWMLRRHREDAKADAPWVDTNWQKLRHGLCPEQMPGVHAYRLLAFASLLSDIGMV